MGEWLLTTGYFGADKAVLWTIEESEIIPARCSARLFGQSIPKVTANLINFNLPGDIGEAVHDEYACPRGRDEPRTLSWGVR